MSEAVVDQLEVVEINEENGHVGLGPHGSLQAELQVLEERGSVCEACQRVVHGSMSELLSRLGLDELPLADVCDHSADDQNAVLGFPLGSHPVENPTDFAVGADQAVLDLHRLAVPQLLDGSVVDLAVVRVNGCVVRVFSRHPLGDGADQSL
jgi:hypothetical protein